MSSRPALADHLLSLSAPRAAARLMPSVVAARATQDFAVPAAHVRLVDSAATASDFTAAMERLLLRRSTVGFDAEWRPDAHGVRSEPSLLQLAEETGDVWLLDVASTVGFWGEHDGLGAYSCALSLLTADHRSATC